MQDISQALVTADFNNIDFGNMHISAFMADDDNVLLVNVSFTKDAMVDIELDTPNMWDLPVTAGHNYGCACIHAILQETN